MKKWHDLGFFGKRIHGFLSYLFCTFLSLFIPEAVDTAMLNTLKKQFDEYEENKRNKL